jgi:hypothetical protein
MSDHPYAVGNTLTPGEKADDDPFSDGEWCEECNENVEPVQTGVCPICGEDVV